MLNNCNTIFYKLPNKLKTTDEIIKIKYTFYSISLKND